MLDDPPRGDTRILQLDTCVLDLGRHLVLRDEGTSRLTSNEVGLLAYLAARPGQAVPRRELHERVWGYNSRVVSRAVDTAVARLRSKIEGDPADPRHLITVYGVGYRLELGGPAEPAEPSPTNLRAQASAFVGREVELEAVVEGVAAHRLVTLVGPGGVGKTRLAREVGRTLSQASRFAGGIWFCQLASATDVGGLVRAVGVGLGARLRTRSGPERQVLDLLAARGPCLLILDNFEQIARLAGETVGRWLAAAPAARFLVTSRTRLGLPSELGLEVPLLSQAEAISLIAVRAREVDPSLDLELPGPDRSGEAVAELVDRLDRLPLAIELAASRLRVLSASDLLERLESRLALLARRGEKGRHATLREAIAWSWDLLSEPERVALARCSVFRGGFSLAAAEAVIGVDAGHAVELVEALVAQSLLVADRGQATRFSLLESIRLFAAEQLAARGLEADARARHVAFYRHRGEELRQRTDSAGGGRALVELQLESDNLLAAFDAARDAVDVVQLTGVVCHAARHVGPLDLVDRVYTRALAAARELGGVAHAETLFEVANARIEVDPPQVRAQLAEAWELARAAGADAVCARVLHAQSYLAGLGGAHDEALDLLDRALAVSRSFDDARQLVTLLAAKVGELTLNRRYTEALEVGANGLALARRHGLRLSEGILLGQLGMAEYRCAHLDDAVRRLRGAVQAHHEVGDRYGEAVAHHHLAIVEARRRRNDSAVAHYREALAAAREVGNRRLEALILSNLGSWAIDTGDLWTAVEHLERARAVHAALGDRRAEAVTLGSEGLARMCLDQLDRARSCLQRALDLLGDGEFPRSVAFVYTNLGDLEHRAGDLEAARGHLEAARALFTDVGDRRMLGLVLAHLAALCPDLATGAALHARADDALSGVDDPGLHAAVELYGGFLQLARGRRARARAVLRRLTGDADAAAQSCVDVRLAADLLRAALRQG